MKRLAVVILNWNGEALLRKYLPVVAATTISDDVELVVADNASTDGSLAYLEEEFPDVRTIVLDQNYGFAGGYNRAIAQLDNEYVLLLNSDVATTTGWTDNLIQLMDSDTYIAACAPKLLDDKRHSHFEYAGAAGGFIDWLGYPFCRGRIMDDIEADNGQYDDNADVLWVSGAALMVRRQAYIDCGGLDEDFFAHMEEIDLCWRLRNRGMRIVACGESRVYHLGGATLNSSNPRKTYLNFRNNLTMLVKNYNNFSWPLVLFMRLLLDGVAGVKFIIDGKKDFCWAIVRAHWSFFGSFKAALSKRKALAPYRTTALPQEVKRYSILLHYYLKRQTTYKS